MLAKIWKKLGLFILIILCLCNIVHKLVAKVSFDDAIEAAKTKIETTKNYNKENNKK